MIDLVDLEHQRVADIVAHQLEGVGIQQAIDILASTGEEVVDADDLP
jgi:hypothetical protein